MIILEKISFEIFRQPLADLKSDSSPTTRVGVFSDKSIKDIGGSEAAILFSAVISHCDIGTKRETVSAGFFMVGALSSEKDKEDIIVAVWGKRDRKSVV